jgi:hypothetical protein
MHRQADDADRPDQVNPGDDPDGDGATNHLEYAFSTNPFDAASVFTPVPGILKESDGMWATLEFRRRTDSATLTYEVLESTDLVRWAPVADVQEILREPVAGQPGLETVRLAIRPALVPHKPCFLSVRVGEVRP